MFELLSFCWKSINNKGRYIAFMTLSLVKELLKVALPLVTGWIINLLVSGGDFSAVIFWCVMVGLLSVLSAFLGYVVTLLYTKTQFDSAFALQSNAIMRVQHFWQGYYGKDFDPGYLSKRVNNDSEVISMFFLMSGSQVLSHALTTVVVIALVAIINLPLAFVCLLLTFAVGLAYVLSRREVFERGMEYKEKVANFFSVILHEFSDVEFIRRHVLFDRFATLLSDSYSAVRDAVYRVNRVGAIVGMQTEIAKDVLQIAVIFVGAYQIMMGAMRVGYLATVASYFAMLSASAEYFTQFGSEYQDCRSSFERLRQLSDTPLEQNGDIEISDKVYVISCNDLSFTYPGNDIPTISGANIRFEGCGLYGLLGRNGCGKSTLLKLIAGEWCGHYEGTICFDDQELGTLDHYGLRRTSVGFTEQEPTVIEDSLWNNLTLLCEEQPEREEVLSLCDQLRLTALIGKAPQGLDTIVDGTNVSLSGGEKQKVAIIRMLLKNPPVMLMDEPSSALDADSVNSLVELLGQLKRDHLIIMVSHDERLINACDELVRL